MPGSAESYLKWEEASGTPTTGIRNKAGVLEAKNKGGSWVEITAWDRSGTNLVPTSLSTDTVIAGTFSCTFLGATGDVVAGTVSSTTANVLSTMTTVGLSSGNLLVSQAQSAFCYVAQVSEVTTISAAATSDTVVELPANSIILGIGGRVNETITTAATFSVKGATSATSFAASVAVAQGTTFSAMTSCPYYNATAQKIRITPDVQPADAAGRVRLVINYIQIGAPTS